MCGRFVGYRQLDELQQFFPIDRANCDVAANFNVAPTQEILAIYTYEGENWLDRFHWGLVPFWAKDPSIGNRMINARAETIAEKPSFKNAFKKRRCLIIADGFYEWKGTKGQKQPMLITLPDKKPFAFAGLWEIWYKNKQAPAYRSCTIITTEASASIREIHHRMPVILKPEVYRDWLNPQYQNTENLKHILAVERLTELTSYPVSKQVNFARNNDLSLLDPIK
ncbi:MAG: SOS response-associated peptidase [Desulfobacterales bacterium]|nr:SOS response-associated peptidase [Desulfobacterales bacterium]